MKVRTQKTTWMAIAGLFTVMAGAPVWADDTELLLVNPNPNNLPKPNVLFILDTSGSMDSEEETAEPYDSTQTYSGDCDTDMMYWTDVDVTPVCDGNETQFFPKTAFLCDFASMQIAGIGSFTNTMVQYRAGDNDGTGPGPTRWQYLAPGYNTQIVECQADSGVHGDGRPAYLWPTSASDSADAFVNSASDELSWGSSPRNLSYTVFDGNYLNWKASPTTVKLQRIDIVKKVTTKVLQSVDNMNVGLMRFNENDGGPVIHAIEDLGTSRASILSAIDGLPAAGNTPISEVLYESALYWQGSPAYYGERINTTPTDPDALVSNSPEVYKQPVTQNCAKNFNVLLSDGKPNNDDEAEDLAPTLPGFSTALGGRTACTDEGTNGSCMDDITQYLSIHDNDDNVADIQTVTTHTIGFAIDLPILKSTAELSGGQYFLADDVESLTIALLQIISDINDRSLSFSAPAVSVNSFNRTQNLNDLYLTMFGARSKVRWPGNLKKYKITKPTGTDEQVITDADNLPAVDPDTGFFFDTARSFWTPGPTDDGNDVLAGGAANRLPDPAVRNLYSNVNGNNIDNTNNHISLGNSNSFAPSDFGLTGANGEPTKDEIIRWMRGEDVRDEDNKPATTIRYAMGDPLHSQPAAVVYGGTAENPDVVVFTATNDGYLHAIDGDTGDELWSFVPEELLPNMTRLYLNPSAKYKQYGLDGSIVPVIKDDNGNGIIDGSDFVYLIVGMRRGGSSYYALDVKNKNAPELLWQTTTGSAGQSWSTPVVAKINIGGAVQNADKAVVVLGDGYDSVHDTAAHPSTNDGSGAGITMLDLKSGAVLWSAGSAGSGANLKLEKMKRAIPNEVRVVDISGDGFADRMYASDMGGQLWRFDIVNGKSASGTEDEALVRGGVIARLGAEGLAGATSADTRRFYSAPDVSLFNDTIQDQRFIAISIGSGYRAHPFDLSATDRFFSIRDPDVFRTLSQLEYDNYVIADDASLVEVSGKKQVVIGPTDRGWKFTLPASQKVLTDSLTFDDSVFFVAFSPDSAAAATCSAGRGSNILYQVSVINGDPVVDDLDALAAGDADDARRKELKQGGIAPSPTILFPSPDDPSCTGHDCAPPPIGCVGVECFDPGFENNPVRTLWSQDGIE